MKRLFEVAEWNRLIDLKKSLGLSQDDLIQDETLDKILGLFRSKKSQNRC